MLRYVKDEEGGTMMRVLLDGKLCRQIQEHAKASGTTAASWAREALEFMIHEHRSGRFHPEPNRHWERNGNDADHVVE